MIPNDRYAKFLWNPSWVFPYESSRGVFEKFCLLNGVSTSLLKDLVSKAYRTEDLGSVFGVSFDIKLEKRHRENLAIAREAFTSEALGSRGRSSLLHALLELDSMYSYLAWMLVPENHFWLERRPPIFLFEKSRIRYCSSCRSVGYHSNWHQCLIVNNCPIHGVPLISTCSECGEEHYSRSGIDWPSSNISKQQDCGKSIFGSNSVDRVTDWLNFPERTTFDTEVFDGFFDLDKWYRSCSDIWKVRRIERYGVVDNTDLASKFASSLANSFSTSAMPNEKSGNYDSGYAFIKVRFGEVLSKRGTLLATHPKPYRSKNVSAYIKEYLRPALEAIYRPIRRYIEHYYLKSSRRANQFARDQLYPCLGVTQLYDKILPANIDYRDLAWLIWISYWEDCNSEEDFVVPVDPNRMYRSMVWLPIEQSEIQRMCGAILLGSFHRIIAETFMHKNGAQGAIARLAAINSRYLSGLYCIPMHLDEIENSMLFGWKTVGLSTVCSK